MTNNLTLRHCLMASLIAVSSLSLHVARAATLTPQPAITLPGGPGSFDYMMVDLETNRLYASHPGAKTLTVLNLRDRKPREIDLGAEVNGVAVDKRDNKFFTAGGGQKVFVFNLKTMKLADTIGLNGPGDDIFYDPDNGMLYVDNDESTNVWVMDAATNKIVSTITVDGAPEYIQYDPATKRLYQNIKPANELQVIDTTTNKVVASWPSAPAKSPHGLVFDPSTNRLYSAGKNDTLIVIDATTGSVLSSVALASPVDQIAFDPKLRRIYCPGNGFMTIVSLAANGDVTGTDKIAVSKSAHTVAVDPKTSTVWISYTEGNNSYLQAFKPVLASVTAQR